MFKTERRTCRCKIVTIHFFLSQEASMRVSKLKRVFLKSSNTQVIPSSCTQPLNCYVIIMFIFIVIINNASISFCIPRTITPLRSDCWRDILEFLRKCCFCCFVVEAVNLRGSVDQRIVCWLLFPWLCEIFDPVKRRKTK